MNKGFLYSIFTPCEGMLIDYSQVFYEEFLIITSPPIMDGYVVFTLV